MKILHYISDPTAANHMTAAARAMMTCTEKVVETQIVTVRGVPGLKKMLEEFRPDVVHVHGAWDFAAARVEWVARHSGVVTIVSPHRGLSQEIINIDFWKRKLPRLLAYQIWMVRGCTAVVAVNERERDGLMALGLKKRIEVVPIDGLRDGNEGLRDALMAAYRKALDSTYQRRITQAERDFVLTAVRAAVVVEGVGNESGAGLSVGSGTLSFRNIFFHAYDEDVTDLMLQGVQRLSLSMPPTLDVAAVPRYKNRKAKLRGSIIDAGQCAAPLEGVAVAQIAKSAQIGLGKMTLRNYVELYRLFRYTDFNEDTVAAELKRRHLRRHTLRLQSRLSDMFSLPPGYNIF